MIENEQRKYNDKIFKVDKDGKRIDKDKNTPPDFQEEQDLIQNLLELETNKDNSNKDNGLKIAIEKAIDSKNAWNQIHSNKKIQRIIIIRTIILGISTILQVLTSIFDKEISSRNLCFKLYITFVILSFTIIGIVMYRYSTKDK